MLSLPSWQSMNITVNFFSTKYMNHCVGCTILPEHMKVKLGSMDELPCYAERVDGVSENEEYSLDEAEFENNNSNNSDLVPDVCDDSISHDSPNSQDQGYKGGSLRRTIQMKGWHEPGRKKMTIGKNYRELID
ncbi:unnamed protein product [Lupinus luteus]|uniref:Uncharacterized protein n=1 Tax=Lupinus luteus TaxID=3873 RepID=A0AAV1XDQ5_LUPLU